MDEKFQFRLSSDRREALRGLAHEAGVSESDLVRLAIGRLIEERDVKLPAPAR